MLVRVGRADDTPHIVALWSRFMNEEGEAVPDADETAARASWSARLARQLASENVLVCGESGALTGFLALLDHADRAWIPAGVAYVVDLYVAPEARPHGAAAALIGAARQFLSNRYGAIWTNTHENNRRMQILLRRAGFTPLENFTISGLAEQRYYAVAISSPRGPSAVADRAR